MVSAKFDRNTITIETEDKNTVCKTSGSVLKFDGFLKVYKNPNSEDDDEILPEVNLLDLCQKLRLQHRLN